MLKFLEVKYHGNHSLQKFRNEANKAKHLVVATSISSSFYFAVVEEEKQISFLLSRFVTEISPAINTD